MNNERGTSLANTAQNNGFQATSKTENSGLRSTSLGGKNMFQLAEQEARSKSYKNRAYINNAKIGCTDYKFNYGESVGNSPMDLMNRVSIKQPIRDHPLKKGTNQLWS